MKPRRGTVSGKPLEEPVAWYGPVVMNTQEQIRYASEELREETFLASSASGRAVYNRVLFLLSLVLKCPKTYRKLQPGTPFLDEMPSGREPRQPSTPKLLELVIAGLADARKDAI